MLDSIGENDSVHLDVAIFRISGMKIPENRLKYTLNNNNQHPHQKFNVGEGFVNVFIF